MLHYPLSERVCNSWDLELLCAIQSFVIKPRDMLRIVGVDYVSFAVFLPSNDLCPFNTMLWLTRDVCEGAKRYCGTWR